MFTSGTKAVARLLAFLALFASLCAPALAARYTYDELGRLKTVTVDSETAEYVYDAVGNLLEVKRYAGNTLALTSFAPLAGPAGTTVTVHGHGFDATAIVKFNSVLASAQLISAQTLTATVPPGATTGRITVDVGAQSVTSARDFVVAGSDGAPTISALSTQCTVMDGTVTVTGSNFDVGPQGTRVEIGARIAKATVASSTQLTFVAPRFSMGGKVRVITAAGIAEFPDPVSILPTGYTCAGISAVRTIVVDAPAMTVTLAAAKATMLLFEGQRDSWLTLTGSGITSPSGDLRVTSRVYRPDGTQIGMTTLTATQGTLHLPRLSHAGTHVLLAQGLSTTADTTVSLRLASAPELVADGPGLPVSAASGQTVRVIVSAPAGQGVGIGVNGIAIAPATALSTLQLHAPDVTNVAAGFGSQTSCQGPASGPNPGCHINIPGTNEAASYGLVWSPTTTATASATLWLSLDVAGPLEPDVPRAMTLRQGQNARPTFTAAAGTGVSISTTALPAGTNTFDVRVFKPDGVMLPLAQIGGTTTYSTPGGTMHLFNLPTTGTYSVLAEPRNGATASFELNLDPGAPLTLDGAALRLTTTKAGKAFRAHFDATARQRIGIGLVAMSVTPSNATALPVALYGPAGTPSITSQTCTIGPTGCEIDYELPDVSGRYTLTIEPAVTITNVSVDVLATQELVQPLTATPTTHSVTRQGGNARLTFEGVPGQGQTITIADLSAASQVTVYRPDGAIVRAPLYTSGSLQTAPTATYQIGDFPLRGTYSVFIDPTQPVPVSFKASIAPGVTVTENGVPTYKTVIPGAWYRGEFTGAIGESRAIGVHSMSFTNPTGSSVVVSAYDPDVRAVSQVDPAGQNSTCQTSIGSCDFDLPTHTKAGTYQYLVELPVAKPSDASIQTVVSDDVVIVGTSGSFTLSNVGQNGRLVFPSTQGRTPTVTLTRAASSEPYRDVRVIVFSPTGAQLTAFWMTGAQNTLTTTLPSLPVTGNYAVWIDRSYGFATTITASVASN